MCTEESISKLVYYIGRLLGDYEESGSKWSIEGIYSSFEKAVENIDNDEFIVEVTLDEKLPKELHEPSNFWWCIDGKIIDKDENKL